MTATGSTRSERSARSARFWPHRATAWMSDTMHSQWGTAVSRIVYGAFVVLTVLINWRDRQWFWGAGSAWTQPYRDQSRFSFPLFRFFTGNDSAGVLDLKLVVLGVLGLMMMVGLFSRVSTILVFFLTVSLIASGPTSTDTEDTVVRIMLLWLCFADTSQRLSVDAWIAKRRGRRPGLIPGWIATPVHNAAVVLIMAQIIIVYLFAGLAKLRGPLWRDGTAIYYPMHAGFLSPWPALSHLVTVIPPAVYAMTWGSVVLQIVFGLLLLSRRTRLLAIVSMVGLHIGIAVFLGLGLFSLAMVGADFVFVRDETVDRLTAWLTDRRTSRSQARDELPAAGPEPGLN